jgi:hypothetical protein
MREAGQDGNPHGLRPDCCNVTAIGSLKEIIPVTNG